MKTYNRIRTERLKVETQTLELQSTESNLFLYLSDSDCSLISAGVKVLEAISARLYVLEHEEDKE